MRMKEFALRLLIIKESFSIPKNTLMRSERRKAKEDELQFHDLRVIYTYTLEGDCGVIDTQRYFDYKTAWGRFANVNVSNHAHFPF